MAESAASVHGVDEQPVGSTELAPVLIAGVFLEEAGNQLKYMRLWRFPEQSQLKFRYS